MNRFDKNKSFSMLIFSVFAFLFLTGTALAAWPEVDKLLDDPNASGRFAGDYAGRSVSISGDYAIVGAYGDREIWPSSGAAYIFKRDGLDWVQQARLKASDVGTTEDQFGWSVSISGDYVIVGSNQDDVNGVVTGSAFIFKRTGTTWNEIDKLLASDGAGGDSFGASVAIDSNSNYVIIGASGDDGKGSAYIFAPNDTNPNDWVEVAKLIASDGASGDDFGKSVSISGNYAIVGAEGYDEGYSDIGAAYIFSPNDIDPNIWDEVSKITGTGGAYGEHFGCSVSIDGDRAIAGAWQGDGGGLGVGTAYIFESNDVDPDTWEQMAKLEAIEWGAGDKFGWSASISGDFAVVGAKNDDDNGAQSGSAFVFYYNGENWIQVDRLLASDGAATDYFSQSVSVSGGYAIIGADGDDMGWATNAGSAYVFSYDPGTLTLLTPNGGEELVAGTTYEITWDTNGIIENVSLEYSTNNSSDWTAIDTVPNTDSYIWEVPDVNSQQCLVYVSDSVYPIVNDTSDGVFTMYICELASDLDGNCVIDFYDFGTMANEWLKCGNPFDPNCQP